ncbi:endothelin-converting enzyme 1-like [Amblyomma americanum]
MLVAVLICVGVVSIALLLYKSADPRARPHCATTSCAHHRGLIESQLDTSVNPCDDFAAYVCGRWTPRKEFSELSRSALMDMVMAWLKKLRDTLDRSLDVLPAGRKAAAMFNSCMTQTGSQVDIVKEFMREHGLIWPEDPTDKLGPLEVLIDLAFNWNVDLWFSLKLLLPNTVDDYSKRRIFIAPNNLILQWRTLFRQIPRTYFEKVYSNIYRLFNTDVDKVPPRVRIAVDYGTVKDVFEVLSSSAWKARVPAVFPLRDLEKYTDASTAHYIKESIDTMMRIEPPVTMDDLMLMSDMALLKALVHIFNFVSDHAVRRHLAWLFLQGYAAVANPEVVLLVMHGSKRQADIQRPMFCAGQVEASYRLLVSAMATVAYFPEEERRRIDSHLARISEVAVEKTTAAVWLDNTTRDVAVEKLKDVRTVLWPDEKFLTAQGLEEYYANFTEAASSFADFWIKTRRSLRRLVGSDAGCQELRIRDGIAEPYVEYLHVLNEVSLSLGALLPPLYYKDGTKAMLYGGLGYFYAMELVGAVDTEGVKVDPRGNFVSSWLSEAVKPVFEERVLGCLATSNTSIFPEVPAMEVAFAAFKRDLNEKDAQLSDELTEEKVFFITACLPSCAATAADNLYGGDCNKAVANFAPFARTFQCPLGSKMNPQKKCTFFD